jgi:TM2 domain-containing membrane protein YozV
MDMQPNAYMHLSDMTTEEMGFLQQATAQLNETQQQSFFNVYASKRKSSQDILLFSLLGFVGVAGVHRFILGQTFMGLVYLFTGGFCAIGTIVDIINRNSLTLEYNKKMAYETFQIITMGGGFPQF